MMKKIFIVGLIVCSFFVVSASTVLAADETIIPDDAGDVVDYISGETVSSNPNINIDDIDIIEMTYSRQGNSITLSLEVNGNIANRGNINDLESDVADVVAYSLMIYNSTSAESYVAYYVNTECQITYESTEDTEDIPVSTLSVEGSTLAVSFDLLSDKTYDTIEAMAEFYKISGEDYEYLVDVVPDLVTLEVTADSSTSEGTIGENIDFSGEALDGTPEYTWLWDFDDGATSTDQNPIHSYAEAGTYEVTLSVTDADGNEGSSFLTISVSDTEPSNGGDNDDGQESSNSGLILFVVVIAIIAIAGVSVVVYIIRR